MAFVKRCPKCGKDGFGPYSRLAGRGMRRRYWYFAHKDGRVRWCYLGKDPNPAPEAGRRYPPDVRIITGLCDAKPMREIASDIGVKALSTVFRRIHALERKGLLKRIHGYSYDGRGGRLLCYSSPALEHADAVAEFKKVKKGSDALQGVSGEKMHIAKVAALVQRSQGWVEQQLILHDSSIHAKGACEMCKAALSLVPRMRI